MPQLMDVDIRPDFASGQYVAYFPGAGDTSSPSMTRRIGRPVQVHAVLFDGEILDCYDAVEDDYFIVDSLLVELVDVSGEVAK